MLGHGSHGLGDEVHMAEELESRGLVVTKIDDPRVDGMIPDDPHKIAARAQAIDDDLSLSTAAKHPLGTPAVLGALLAEFRVALDPRAFPLTHPFLGDCNEQPRSSLFTVVRASFNNLSACFRYLFAEVMHAPARATPHTAGRFRASRHHDLVLVSSENVYRD